MALECQDDHGWAVYSTQDTRRCLLLDIVDGLTDDEALWTGLSAWAAFPPGEANLRRNPGKLFYPTEAAVPLRHMSLRSTGTTGYV
jgi:hypothetical protein